MTVTNWRPALDRFDGPLYRALADQICAAVGTGAIPPGAKMPPVRDMAWQIGVSPGAVARAYRIGVDRGLLEATVGRGTFARDAGASDRPVALDALTDDHLPGKINLRGNRAVDVGQGGEITAALQRLIERHGTLPLAGYFHRRESLAEREAIAAWMRGIGVPAEAGRLIVTSGAHEGVAACMAAIARAGNGILLTEPHVHPGIRDAADALGFRLEPVAADDEGMLPDALEAATRRHRPDAVLLSTALHNPTMTTMSAARRSAVVETACRLDLSMVEDDVYGLLTDPYRGSVLAEAPERTWYVTSLSKCVAAGIRTGMIVAPPDRVNATVAAHQSLTHRLAWLIPALAAELVASGDASRIRSRVRDETMARAAIAARILGPHGARTDPEGSFVYLPLAEGWSAADFTAAAAARDVLVAQGSAYTVGRPAAPARFVRVALGTDIGIGRAAIETGLARLAGILAEGPQLASDVT